MTTSNPLHLALGFMQQGLYDQARLQCQRVLDTKPDDFNALHLLGVIEMNANDTEVAVETLTQASRLSVADRFRSQALSNLSLALKQCARTQDALDAIEKAIALQPQEVAFHLNRLALLECLEQWSDLISYVEKDPQIAAEFDAQLMQARAERHLERWNTAFARLQRLIDPEAAFEIEVWGEWALVSARLGRREDIVQLLESVGLSERQAVADYLAEEGEQDTASWLYGQILQRDPGNVYARHLVNAADGKIDVGAPHAYVRGVYDAHAEEFEQRLVGRLGYDAPARLTQLLQARLPGELGMVADLGCGSGLLGRELRRAFRIGRLLGCDLSAAMLQQAEEKSVYDELAQQDLITWLQRHRNLQLICATDVLIYIGDLRPTLHAAETALLSEGIFAFTVEQDDDSIRLTPSGRYRHSASHIHAAAAETGFCVEHCEPFPLRREQGKMITGLMVLLCKA